MIRWQSSWNFDPTKVVNTSLPKTSGLAASHLTSSSPFADYFSEIAQRDDKLDRSIYKKCQGQKKGM